MDLRDRALLCLKLVDDKKAINSRLFDMQGKSSIADFILVCSGSSDRQVKAIADFVTMEMKKVGSYAMGVEGSKEGKWILVDYGDIIVNIFHEEIRDFYSIESLWPFAKEITD
jgi:ribosome-associated protein